MSETVTVCCRLPNGFIFHYPSEDIDVQNQLSNKIYLKGANKDNYFKKLPAEEQKKLKLHDFNYGMTEVSKEIWEKIEKIYTPNFAPFKSKAIFALKSSKTVEKDIEREIDDLVKSSVKTGLEPSKKEMQVNSEDLLR